MNMPLTQELVEKKYHLYHSKINEALAACFDKELPVTLYAPAAILNQEDDKISEEDNISVS